MKAWGLMTLCFTTPTSKSRVSSMATELTCATCYKPCKLTTPLTLKSFKQWLISDLTLLELNLVITTQSQCKVLQSIPVLQLDHGLTNTALSTDGGKSLLLSTQCVHLCYQRLTGLPCASVSLVSVWQIYLKPFLAQLIKVVSTLLEQTPSLLMEVRTLGNGQHRLTIELTTTKLHACLTVQTVAIVLNSTLPSLMIQRHWKKPELWLLTGSMDSSGTLLTQLQPKKLVLCLPSHKKMMTRFVNQLVWDSNKANAAMERHAFTCLDL